MKNATHRHATHVAIARCLTALASIVLVMITQPAQANAPAPEQATSQYEVHFMQEMIGHHMMAVDMGNICLAKAAHQELRALCQKIITVQQEEISTMQQWLAEWYGISNFQPQMNPGQQTQLEKLSMLNNAEFEIEFMQKMIRHHKMAVVKGSQCIEHTYHQDLQDMCAGIVSGQLAEIQQMQEWLCTWYGVCRPRHQR